MAPQNGDLLPQTIKKKQRVVQDGFPELNLVEFLVLHQESASLAWYLVDLVDDRDKKHLQHNSFSFFTCSKVKPFQVHLSLLEHFTETTGEHLCVPEVN